MNIKIVVVFLFLINLTVFPQFSQDQLSKSNLTSIGTISVTIGGSFPLNGTYPAFITERVDAFVSRMYVEAIDITLQVTSDPDLYRKLKQQLNNFALRGITLKRANGEEVEVDLQKFRLTGEFGYNPYLKNDDD